MANLEKRGGRTPRRVREQRAYRAAQIGTASAVGTVATGILAIVGTLSWGLPILLAILTALSVWAFLKVTGQR